MNCKLAILVGMMLGLLMVFTSCVKDNEISQTNTSEPTSVITSNLIVGSLEASSFIDESTQLEKTIRIDTTQLDLISSDFFKEELTKSNLTFHFKNSLERDFKIDFEFLNDLDELKFKLQIPVSSGTTEKPMTVETSVVIESPELTSFKEATKLVCKIILLPSDKPLVPQSEGSLNLQSDATYFFDI